MFVRVQVPPRVQNPQLLLWVFCFQIDLKSLFKKQRFCFENNSIWCTIILKNNVLFLGIFFGLIATNYC